MQSLNTKTSIRLGPIPVALKTINSFILPFFGVVSIQVSYIGFAAEANTLTKRVKLDCVYIQKHRSEDIGSLNPHVLQG